MTAESSSTVTIVDDDTRSQLHSEGVTTGLVSAASAADKPPESTVPTSTDPDLPTPTPTSSNQQNTTASSSWWSYIGLSGTATMQASQEPSAANTEPSPASSDALQQDKPADNVISLSQDGPSHAGFETSLTADESTPSQHVQDAEPTSEVQIITTSPSDDKPQSLSSAETAQSQGSAWYLPWGWYGSTTSATPASNGGVSKLDSTGQNSADECAKTESEIVKEEALARSDPAPTAQSPTVAGTVPATETPSSPSPSANPIESSISANRSGWASFFMSRALITKSITEDNNKRDENGMEVMDVDEDDDAMNQEGTIPDTAGMPSSPRSIVSTPGQSQAHASSVQPVSKSPTAPKQRESGKPAPAVPLTNSESIKKETAAARSSSPAPSTKRSGSSTPVQSKPEPPNLVLPTWADTFHSLPRSSVPRPPSPPRSTLSKTLSAVSGVLFAKDDQSPGSVKGKERQSEHEFLQFGKELPKAFDILGQTLDPNVLSGNCRIVVIGVAGWSPGASLIIVLKQGMFTFS